jgi:hypothetical protein
MLSVRPVAPVVFRPGSHPPASDARRNGAIAMLDAIAKREASDHDFEIALLARIARLNRHAETEK